MEINKYRNLFALFTVTPFIIFMLLSFSCITIIGLNYDESIFVNSALGGINDGFVFKRLFGIPFMVFPDQGALKSYLYYPIFKLFGVNVFSIRVPTILLSTLTLLIWFKIAKKILNTHYWAIIFLTLLATDPAFIIHSKVDASPIVLQNLLVALTLYFYQRSFECKSLYYVFLSCFTMILGLLNKINFLWFVLPFIYIIGLYDREHIFLIYTRHRANFSALLVIFTAALLVIIAFLIIPPALHFPIGGMTHVRLSEKIFIIIKLYLGTLNGSAVYQNIFHQVLSISSMANIVEIPCIVLSLVFATGVHFLKIRNETYQRYKKHILFFLMLFVFELMFVLFTPHTYTPGHIMMLWPLPHLLFILMLAAIISLFPKNNALFLFSQLIVMGIILSQCYVNYEYHIAFKNPKLSKNYLWTPAIYKLSDYVNQHSEVFDNIISVDMGTQTPLFALAKNDKERLKFHEFWFLFTDTSLTKKCAYFIYPFFEKKDAVNQQWVYDHYYKGKRNLIIMYADIEVSHRVKQSFFEFSIKHHIQVMPITTMTDTNGDKMYSLFIALN